MQPVDAKRSVRLVAYNMGQGGARHPELRTRLVQSLEPDMLFVQETRDPWQGWLPALQALHSMEMAGESWLWIATPNGRWGTGLWVRDGTLTPLPVPEDFTGRVAAAVVEGRVWDGLGKSQVVALSVHAPTRKGSNYIKEVGRILDFAVDLAGGRPMVLAGDFNVAVGVRPPEHTPTLSRSERALLERLRDLGLIACWQSAHPGERLARTLRWMHRLDSLPYHCDGIFVPANWAPALEDCVVLEDEDWCALSDHNPVVATFAFGGARG